MADPGQHDQGRAGDLGMEVLGDEQGRSNVAVAVDEQGRHVDMRQHLAQVLGGRLGHGPKAGRVEPRHAGAELVDRRLRRRLGEHRGQQGADELVGWEVGQHHRLGQSLAGDVGRSEPAQPA